MSYYVYHVTNLIVIFHITKLFLQRIKFFVTIKNVTLHHNHLLQAVLPAFSSKNIFLATNMPKFRTVFLYSLSILAAMFTPYIYSYADDRTGPVEVPRIIKSESTKDDDEEQPYLLLVGQAEKAANEQNWEEAAARLKDAMSVEPSNPSNVLLLANLGMIYSYQDKDSLAIATLDEANRIEPKIATIVLNRGRIKLKIGRDKQAYDDFSHVIELDSLNTDARYFHGIIALYSGDMTTAESDFNILKSLRPKSRDTAVALSSLYSLTGRDREAIPYYQSLIKDEPAAEYYASLAGCYLATNNLTDAAATISEGLEKYPRDAELYYYRAWLNRDRMLFDEAKADAKLAIKFGASTSRVNALFEK
jgi:tetratricopeptide (TPR) repeat protein